ncbi:golgi-body localization protein domain-containing protein [Lipomyces arxii]|uniref:golgi-body localization protein domain-containing protein n=1 Tax=Lipomyces arxii TaxID=56418 RepID=UPI0034CDACD4
MHKPEGISLMLVELGALFCFTHLLAFVVFAFIRILTGVSIQRLGYFSLRHISFTQKSGIQCDIRSIKITVHRPAFSRPSWVSLIVADTSIYVDSIDESTILSNPTTPTVSPPQSPLSSSFTKEFPFTKANAADQALLRLSKLIHKIHKSVPLLRLVDLSIRNTSIITEDLGTFTIRSITLHADVVSRPSKLPHFFSPVPEHQHKNGDDVALSWKFVIKDIFYAEDKGSAEEVLDLFQFDLHELFKKATFTPLSVSLNVRIGNLTIPYDKALILNHRIKLRKMRTRLKEGLVPKVRNNDNAAEEIVTERVAAAYALLDIMRELRVHVARFTVYKFTPASYYKLKHSGKPVYFSLSTKDFTVDLRRLHSNSPGHRLYFDSDDVSHQAILTTISVVVGLDDGSSGKVEELVYIPMVTMASTTNFIRKTIQIYTNEVTDKNSSLLKASLTVSSPSVDLHARHLPVFAAMLQSASSVSGSDVEQGKSRLRGRQFQIGQLLPKTIVKLSIEEPAGRIMVSENGTDYMGMLQSGGTANANPRILASACSIINCEFESSHTTVPSPHYSVVMSLRVTDFGTWVRGADGKRQDLVKANTLALKFIAETTPGFDVSITGSLTSFCVFLTRPEIIDNLKDLVKHARQDVRLSEKSSDESLKIPLELSRKSHPRSTFVRQIPSWLSQVKIEGSDVMMSASSLDANARDARNMSRGAAVQVESWILEYKSSVSTRHGAKTRRNQSGIRVNPLRGNVDSELASNVDKDQLVHQAERRRFAIGFRGVEMCSLDENDILDQATPIVAIPDIEMAISTYTDNSNPITDVNILMKKALFYYSLLCHYSLLASGRALKRIFSSSRDNEVHVPVPSSESIEALRGPAETLLFEIWTHVIQFKATLPGAPLLMLETVGLDLAKRSNRIPLVRSRYIRLFVESPTVGNAWERLVVVRHFKLELASKKNRLEEVQTSNEQSAKQDDISIDADAFSISVPYGLVVYQLFEGIVNTFKSLKQIHHQFATDTDTYILTPVAEKPKVLPRIRVRPNVLELRLDDDPFEARLGLIFRVGMLEMNSRLAREAAFEAKLKTLQTAKDLPADQPISSQVPRNTEADSETVMDQAESAHADTHRKGTFRSMRSGMKHKHGRHKHSGVAPIRYSPTDAELPSNTAKISTEEAYAKVLELHSQAWIRRISRARANMANATEARRLKLIGPDMVEPDTTANEKIIGIPDSPPLFHILFDDADIVIDKPHFPMADLPQFLHAIGKGLPLDTKFTLLIPFFFQLQLSQARATLRDYPLPAIQVPPRNPSQEGKGPTWSLSSDFTIAEEMFDEQSSRYVDVPIVKSGRDDVKDFIVMVTRTVSSVKLYSNINVDITTSSPTLISWAPSLQPALQQVMMIFDTFTKPPIDPSEKIGFWDKIGLIFHSKLRFSWKEGSVHLLLKGSRDPYEITKTGAGFAMCWRTNVVWLINPTCNHKEFMVVDADEYLLTIPDFGDLVRTNDNNFNTTDDNKSTANTQIEDSDRAEFQKIVMKLSGRVRWQAGLLFERDDGAGRTFNFVPHYQVQLRTPRSIDPSKPYDSYAGFRSNYLHLALSVVSPHDQHWTAFKTEAPHSSYNTIHLSPKVFTHFFAWWNLFAGELSLPIRSGSLFTLQKNNKKFGRHLATIKYQLVLAPLFISHMYLHKRDEDWSKTVINSVGLKTRTESFMMDVHQRREITTYTDKGLNTERRRRNMKINEAEVDFHMADIRAVTATFKERSAEELYNELNRAEGSEVDSPNRSTKSAMLSAKFKVPNNDLTWIDVDDLTELDSLVSSKNLTSVKVLPWLYTPRFTYYRRTEHPDTDCAIPSQLKNTFGKEPSHNCLLGQTDTIRTQTDLISERAKELEEQIKMSTKTLVELQRQARLLTDDSILRQKFMTAKKESEILSSKQHALHELWSALLESSTVSDCKLDLDSVEQSIFAGDKLDFSSSHQSLRALEDDRFSDFNNRFIFHNVQVKWTNSIRNVFLRYIQQVGRRRGLIYYMSRRAVKFIDDLVKEQQAIGQTKEVPDSGVPQTVLEEYVPVSKVFTDLENIEARAMPKVERVLSEEEREQSATESLIDKLVHDAQKHLVVTDEAGTTEGSIGFNSQKYSLAAHSVSGSKSSGRKSGNNQQPSVTDASDDETGDDESLAGSENLEEDSPATDDDALKNLADEYAAHNSYMKIMLATDFSDLSGASEMIENLQREIRQLEEIRHQFQLYTTVLDEQGWKDRRNVVAELENAREELFFIMKAITTGQRRLEDHEAQTTGLLQWMISGQQIIAHLLLEDRTPFVDLALANGTFWRLENSDGSNVNTIEIAMLQAINLLKDALYPELLSPYFEGMKKEDKTRKAVRVYWYMLEAIGGIPVMDQLEVDLIPLKVQLEYDIGQKLFHYIFPDDKESPFMVYNPPVVLEGASAPDGQNIIVSAATMNSSSSSSDSSESESDAASVTSQQSTRSLFGGKHHGDSKSNRYNRSWHARRNTNASSTHGKLSYTARDAIGRSGDNASVRSFVSVQSGDSKMQQAITTVGVRNGASTEHYGQDDDLTKMVDRASNFITFVYVTIPSVELCLSYRGQGSRNIEDVHEFVFRLPTIEYRNKTWSNLDLALRLKKDFIKALISHTGALIENKLRSIGTSSKKRSNPMMIRQISDYAAFTSLSDLSDVNISRTNTKK